ncbi:MAG: bifunctional glutamate N-acetyltransferase/amino-acid acetyltransferase ArgJ [Propionibacteriaceae bacterium]|jgi:glutamate N-acetyltransferase/amino-acid N-acetyltransferase|nr:bifunctional glutamate N-acetyltransferase/amino-acid acetyltransferase ArgJ [Propionibacteriaceae bacterium]
MIIDTTQGVTLAQGFLASGVSAGLKSSGKKDLALVVSQGPGNVQAAVFTTNRFPAAPVEWSMYATGRGGLRAVVLNSGGANACTGEQGAYDAQDMADKVATLIGCQHDEVAVCSTGLIGVHLPMGKVLSGIESAYDSLSPEGGSDAAHAIMTTDTVAKQACYTSDDGWVLGGMAKGAGMLAPGLATMLVVLTTDAKATSQLANSALRQATRFSFDRADSDGCMSTNDTVILMANGASGVIPDPDEFAQAVLEVCISLAKQLIADAEGAEHAITVTVREAYSEKDALEVARAISRSNLFKCAIAGNDPNWGRVLASVGTTQARFHPENVDVYFNGVGVFLDGAPGVPRDQVNLTDFDVHVEVVLHAGDQEATIWTNDLTHGYVSENADYPT